MPEERKRARRVAEFGDDEFGQSRFDEKATAARRFLDHADEVLVAERAEEHLAGLQPAGELGERAELAVEVGPHGHHASAGVRIDAVDERGAIFRTATEREELLELVDDEHGIGMRSEVGCVKCVERLRAGAGDDRVGDIRCEAGERDRRLAAPGRADDCDEPVRPQQLRAARHDIFPPEEQIGVHRERNGARPGYGLRVGSGGAVTPSATTATRSSVPSMPRSWFDPSARSSTPVGGATLTTDAVDADEQDLAGTREVTYPRRAIHGRAHDVVVDGDELARRQPIRTWTPSGRAESTRCNATAARTALTALVKVELLASPSTVAPCRRPP